MSSARIGGVSFCNDCRRRAARRDASLLPARTSSPLRGASPPGSIVIGAALRKAVPHSSIAQQQEYKRRSEEHEIRHDPRGVSRGQENPSGR
jgi:hypothetical protein